MSIEVEGVKGYEYQYKVTLLIALLSNAGNVSLFVESVGMEDAYLIIENGEIKRQVEIQVKGQERPIDQFMLIKWLTHFQDRKSNQNLLQKLIDQNCNTALFITRSRCSDSTEILKTNLSRLTQPNSISISKDWFIEFKNELKNRKFGDSQLKKERELFCQKQAEIITKKTLSEILNRCLILEEFTDEKLNDTIESLLNSKYNVAQTKSRMVYLQLLEVVKAGRNSKLEIYKDIMSCIQANKVGIPIMNGLYIERPEEQKLIQEIEAEGVLLLSGTTQCGKTELAKNIASHFVRKGFDYKIYNSISGINRFFKSNINDKKIAILEDPFGHVSLGNNFLNTIRSLRAILFNRETHHFLIVTTRLELLFEAFNSISIEQCKLNDMRWHDLSIKSKVLIATYWGQIAKDKKLPCEIIELVHNGINVTKEEYLLQIGQLTHLSNVGLNRLQNQQFSRLEHIARNDSTEIARDLKLFNELSADILSLISICSSPVIPLKLSDLKYILSEINNHFSIIEKNSFSSLFGDNEESAFPEYPEGLSFSKDHEKALNILEERGFVNIQENSLILTHPNYYEAGRYLFFEKGSFKQKERLRGYYKCLASLTDFTAYEAAKNLEFVLDKIKNDLRKEIIKIGFVGLNSIFPSVEDISMVFLINNISDLQQEDSQFLVQKIQEGTTSSYNIYWHKRQPYISSKGNYFTTIPIDENIILKVDGQLSNKLLPDLYDAWIYIECLNERNTSSDRISILFQYKEAFVREKIIYKVFDNSNNILEETILLFFDDDHPSVVFSAFRAALLNWFSISNKNKELILELAYRKLKNEQIAIRAFNLISTFSIDYGHEAIFSTEHTEIQKKELWKIWSEIFPTCIDTVPLSVSFNPARFGSTMDDSLKYLDSKNGINVFNSWYKRIDYQIKNNNILDEYEMSIADNLMKWSKDNYRIRKDLFLKLIHYPNTGFLLSNFKWIVEYWTNLHLTEKKQIFNLINSNREDTRWIKAVILNSYSATPEELIQLILGVDRLDGSIVDEIYEIFPEQLLKDCLNVFCGFLNPFGGWQSIITIQSFGAL